MIAKDLLGDEVWECSQEEAREIWEKDPNNRWRIWTHEEVDAHMLSDAETIAGIIQLKKERPGSCL